MDDEAEVRRRLKGISEKRGQISALARDVEIDARTVRSVMRGEHSSNAATIKKLKAHFAKLDRRAAKA